MRALHSTTVNHFPHVLEAMNRVFDDVGIVGRMSIPDSRIDRLERYGAPQRLMSLVRRRARPDFSFPVTWFRMGCVEYIEPIAARLNYHLDGNQARAISTAIANRTAKVSKNYDALHFIEGSGFKSVGQNHLRIKICECRAMHYGVFESELQLAADFPSNGKPNPIREMLDYEYEHSDIIITYSEAAKRSFTIRGYEDDRIVVVPLGLGPQLPRVPRERDPYDVVFVGRGDAFKGLDVAVAAVEELGPPYRLLVAGIMSNEVRSWMGSRPSTHYVGYLDRQELRDLYSRSGAMLLPSIESFGLAAAEAVYHGLPLICGPDTGVAEYIPEDLRTVVSGRAPGNWAAAVRAVTATTSVRDLHGLDLAFCKLSVGSASRRLEEVYRRVLEQE